MANIENLAKSLKPGEQYTSYHGEPYVAISPYKTYWFLVRFVETGTFQYVPIRQKHLIFDKSKPFLCGVGYICDNEEPVFHYEGDVKRTFLQWSSMIHRCYQDGTGYKTWQGTTVCKEWHNFANYLRWVKSQTASWGTNFAIDKDLFSYPDSKTYSPDTCCLIPLGLNSAIKNINRSVIESDKPNPKLHKCCQKIALLLIEYDLFLEERVKTALWRLCEINGCSRIEALIERNHELEVQNRKVLLENDAYMQEIRLYEGAEEKMKHLESTNVSGYIEFKRQIYRIKTARDMLEIFKLIKKSIHQNKINKNKSVKK